MKKGHGTPLHRRAMTPHVAGSNPKIRSTLPIRGTKSIGIFLEAS